MLGHLIGFEVKPDFFNLEVLLTTILRFLERSYASLVGAILGAVVFIGLAVGCGYAVYKRKGKADTTRSTGASLSRSVRSKSSGHRKRVTSGWAGVVDESQDVVDKSQNVLYKNKIAFIESTAAPSKGYIYVSWSLFFNDLLESAMFLVSLIPKRYYPSLLLDNLLIFLKFATLSIFFYSMFKTHNCG